MRLPKLDPGTRALYEAALPKDDRVSTRSMFGGLGSFVNGNMFCGALGARIFLRLPPKELEALLEEPGGGPFEPVKGHAMAGYAIVPDPWKRDPSKVQDGMRRALAWVATLPPKREKKGRGSKR